MSFYFTAGVVVFMIQFLRISNRSCLWPCIRIQIRVLSQTLSVKTATRAKSHIKPGSEVWNHNEIYKSYNFVKKMNLWNFSPTTLRVLQWGSAVANRHFLRIAVLKWNALLQSGALGSCQSLKTALCFPSLPSPRSVITSSLLLHPWNIKKTCAVEKVTRYKVIKINVTWNKYGWACALPGFMFKRLSNYRPGIQD